MYCSKKRPTVPAAPPARVKTSVKARLKKMVLAAARCLDAASTSFNRSGDRPKIKEKYAVSIGTMHGERNETRPARKAML